MVTIGNMLIVDENTGQSIVATVNSEDFIARFGT